MSLSRMSGTYKSRRNNMQYMRSYSYNYIPKVHNIADHTSTIKLPWPVQVPNYSFPPSKSFADMADLRMPQETYEFAIVNM